MGRVIIDNPPKDYVDVEALGLPLTQAWSVPRGQAHIVGSEFKCILVHPSDYMRIVNNGRTPLWTRHERGVIELERDRRKYGRGR